MPAELTIHTDGACRGNPGPGGWGVLLSWNGTNKELSGSEAATTNNRMELTAAIMGLAALKRPTLVRVLTDSQYVIKGITEWLPSWKARAPRIANR
jgi:ribonuclease HI